jgi:hypothetical protein
MCKKQDSKSVGINNVCKMIIFLKQVEIAPQENNDHKLNNYHWLKTFFFQICMINMISSFSSSKSIDFLCFHLLPQKVDMIKVGSLKVL